MREILFAVRPVSPAGFEAEAASPSIRVSAPSLEELQHEAREALIDHFGPAHVAYRVRLRQAPRRSPHPAARVGNAVLPSHVR